MKEFIVFVTVFLTFILPTHQFRLPIKLLNLRSRSRCQKIDTFDQFEKIPSWLKTNCDKLGFVTPTEVQMKSLPSIFAGKDVVVQAHTGSGKTLVYSLPILSRVDPGHAAIQAVIVVPTRELGLQVTSVLKTLAAGSPKKIGIMSVMEGSRNKRQIKWASADPPHIVVGNPKALQRLVDMGCLRLQAVGMVVLDEVDACIIEPKTKKELHLLLSRNLSGTFMSIKELMCEDIKPDATFKDHAKKYIESLGYGVQYNMQRQTIMCSATIPQRQHFAASCFKNGWTFTVPEMINVSEDVLVPPQVTHQHIPCPFELRLSCLSTLLRSELKDGVTVVSGDDVMISDLRDEEISIDMDEESNAEEGKGSSASGKGSSGATVIDASTPAAGRAVYTKQAIVFLDDKQEEHVDVYATTAIKALSKLPSVEHPNGSVDSGTATPPKDDAPGMLVSKRAIEKQSRVGVLQGIMTLDERARVLDAFRYGETQVLVTTDIASRGLDIPSTTLVIQMSLPNRVEKYIHRAGRTGRLYRKGKVITFSALEEAFVVQRFSNELGVPIVAKNIKTKYFPSQYQYLLTQ